MLPACCQDAEFCIFCSTAKSTSSTLLLMSVGNGRSWNTLGGLIGASCIGAVQSLARVGCFPSCCASLFSSRFPRAVFSRRSLVASEGKEVGYLSRLILGQI